MSTDLPTEEDVLAVGLLWWFVYETEEGGRGVPSEWADDFSGAACAVWYARQDALGTIAAIADSERRLDCERARDAVVEAAREWGVRIFGGKRTNGDLLSAVCVLEAALMRRGEEVSRHGG